MLGPEVEALRRGGAFLSAAAEASGAAAARAGAALDSAPNPIASTGGALQLGRGAGGGGGAAVDLLAARLRALGDAARARAAASHLTWQRARVEERTAELRGAAGLLRAALGAAGECGGRAESAARALAAAAAGAACAAKEVAALAGAGAAAGGAAAAAAAGADAAAAALRCAKEEAAALAARAAAARCELEACGAGAPRACGGAAAQPRAAGEALALARSAAAEYRRAVAAWGWFPCEGGVSYSHGCGGVTVVALGRSGAAWGGAAVGAHHAGGPPAGEYAMGAVGEWLRAAAAAALAELAPPAGAPAAPALRALTAAFRAAGRLAADVLALRRAYTARFSAAAGGGGWELAVEVGGGRRGGARCRLLFAAPALAAAIAGGTYYPARAPHFTVVWLAPARDFGRAAEVARAGAAAGVEWTALAAARSGPHAGGLLNAIVAAAAKACV